MLRLLDAAGKNTLAEPEKLKYLLCPVIAQGRADQERFYELFDQYWSEVSKPWVMPKAAKKEETKQPKIPEWLPWLLAGLMTLGLGWTVHKLISHEKTLPQKVHLRHLSETSGKAIVGDTVRVELHIPHREDMLKIRYGEFDMNGEEERSWMEMVHWDSSFVDSISMMHFVVNGLEEEPESVLKVEVDFRPNENDSEDFFKTVEATLPLEFHCPNPPLIDSISGGKDFEVGSEVFLKVETGLSDTTNVVYNWDFEDAFDANLPASVDSLGIETKNYFPKKGQVQIKVTAVRQGAKGICKSEIIYPINIGREDAYLAAKSLQLDHVDPIVKFSYGTWVLLALLGIAMIWYWVRWAMRKAPVQSEEEKQEDLSAAAQRFESPDKGPYFIPFRSQEGNIRVEKDLYRLADVLRQRQEGLRKEMDIPASVKKTIDGGGFPHLLTQTDMVPTEYLFLLDDRSRNSHQGRLFEFMVGFLQSREVLGEIFYFDQRLHSFWNDNFPEGLSPEKLQRLHPYHRVILMSDAHSLIEPESSQGRPSLRPELRRLFLNWKNRLLITPMPLVSWTWREEALYELFPIFPAHTIGLADAAKFLETGMEEDELKPTYASWSQRLAHLDNPEEGEKAPDVNYRRWRTAADHEDYLKDYPQLMHWLKALAVYPKSDWNITLAIGKALAPKGVEVHYDNLLILCRIPWLVNGDMPHRLRKEFLANLDPEVERLARGAVQDEMEAVEALVRGGHANREHQIELALQQFSIDTQKADNQELIRDMLALNLLSQKQVAQLNEKVSPGSRERSAAPLEAFLEKNKLDAEAPERPFFTSNFYRAALFTLAYLVLFALVWNYSGTPELARFIGEESSPTTECDPSYLYTYFFKKECVADRAVELNNQAVGIWNNSLNNATKGAPVLTREIGGMNNNRVAALFAEAISLKDNYELAKSNQSKFYFNTGMHNYHAFLDDSVGVDGLQKAKELFRQVTWDSLLIDGLHGQGLSHFYEEQERFEQPDSSQFFYGEIISLDPVYFDTLQMYPHLQSLIYQNQAGWQAVVFKFVDIGTQQPINNVIVTYGAEEERVRADSFYLGMSLGQRELFEFRRDGYISTKEEFTMGAESVVRTIKMQKVPSTTPPNTGLSRSEALIKEVEDWYKTWEEQMKKQGELFPQQLPEIERRTGEAKRLTNDLILTLKKRRNVDASAKEFESIRSEYNSYLNILKRSSDIVVDDADGDSIPDDEDPCPDLAGTGGYGCPERILNGKVTDIQGETLAGAAVVVKGTTLGVLTDGNGDFTLNLSESSPNIIVVSLSGYGTEEVDIAYFFESTGSGTSYPRPQVRLTKYEEVDLVPEADRDSDGVPDDRDKCPDFAGNSDFSGCPESSIVGFVLDEDRNPVAGANILLKGTITGTVTDIDGKFSIKVPNRQEYTLVINFIGYQNIEKKARAGEQVEISLASGFDLEDSKEQIIVTGFTPKIYVRIDPDLARQGYAESSLEKAIEDAIAAHGELEILSFKDIARNLGKVRREDLDVASLAPFVSYIFYANLNSTRGGERLSLSLYDVDASGSLGSTEISPPRTDNRKTVKELTETILNFLEKSY